MQVDQPIKALKIMSYREWMEDFVSRKGRRIFDAMCHNRAREMNRGKRRITRDNKRAASRDIYDKWLKEERERIS